MKRDESVYLQHIQDAIARIEEYLKDIDEETFSKKHLIQDGVIRQSSKSSQLNFLPISFICGLSPKISVSPVGVSAKRGEKIVNDHRI